MNHASRGKFRESLIVFGLFFLAIILFVVVIRFGTYNIGRERKDVQFGVTFSKLQAESLGLDWRQTFLHTLDDLGVRIVRLPIYWSDVEPREGELVFDDYHWMISEARQRGVSVIPVLGMRVPRWPECHIPPWAGITNYQLPITKQTHTVSTSGFETTSFEIDNDRSRYTLYLQSKILKLLEREVNEFRAYPNILYWQIENEPLLASFGICPFTDLTFTEQEFELVRLLDPDRLLMGTESGEMSSWIDMSNMSDVLGSSLYRTTFNPWFGFYYYPIPPLYYQKKAEYVSHLVHRVIISELQAEPWVEGSYPQFDPGYLQKRFPLSYLRENVSFARKTKLDVVLLWGVEWWEYMRQRGIPEYWDYAQTLF